MSRAAARTSARNSSQAAEPAPLLKAVHQYCHQSELPLTSLLFILPLIVLYEFGTQRYASDAQRQTETRVLAFNMIRQFLAAFGASAKHLPALAVTGILLAWHVARKDRWRLHFLTTLGMAAESALHALALLALGSLVGYCLPLYAMGANWKGDVVLAMGAGVYEEAVFRLFACTILNIIFLDLLRINKRSAYLLIVLVSSILFAAYHYWSPQSAPFRWFDCIFRTVAGIYFSVLFIWRGFGITSGTHATYDMYYFLFGALAR